MKIKYSNIIVEKEKECFRQILERVYEKYPHLIETKYSAFCHAKSLQNPFFKFGKIKSFFLLGEDKKAVGHLAIIFDKRLSKDLGLIGFFECVEKLEHAKVLVERAKEYLKKHKKTKVAGNVNVSIWQNFRFPTSEKNPPFFLEPFSRSYYCDFFRKLGFSVAQKNTSTLQNINEIDFKSFQSKLEKVEQKGYSFVKINEHNFYKFLKDIHQITLDSFTDAWNFVPISFEEFEYVFGSLKNFLQDSCSYIVQDRVNKTAGFCLAMNDIFASKKRLVVKTMAIGEDSQNGRSRIVCV